MKAFLGWPSLFFAMGALSACATGGTSTGEQIDLIVLGDHVVAMDQEGTIYERGAVAVDQGEVVAVGPADEVLSRYRARRQLPGENRVVLPGLINGHSHAAMTLLRGIADDLALMVWLNEYIFPAEVRFVDPEFVRVGTELACWEMIRGGTTTFVDMYYFPSVIAEVVERCGLRAMVSTTVIGQKSPDAADAAEGLEQGFAFIEAWRGRNSRVTPIFGPHSNYTLNSAQLRAVRDAADKMKVPISIHLSESPLERKMAMENYGTTSILHLEGLDFFRGPTIGAHVVWPTEEEIPILAHRAVGVIYNPTSNMKTSAGVAPVVAMKKQGVVIGLGTDGAASNNDLDMWEEMRLATLLQKVNTMDPAVLSADAVLRMATSEGARAIGMQDQIGMLEPGKRADLIQVSLGDVHFVPTYDVLSHLVYVADEQDVTSVVVDGEVLMEEGEIPHLDIQRIRREANGIAGRIREALASGRESTPTER